MTLAPPPGQVAERPPCEADEPCAAAGGPRGPVGGRRHDHAAGVAGIVAALGEPGGLEHVDRSRGRRIRRPERVRERAEAHRALVGEPREGEPLERRERARLGIAAGSPLAEQCGEQPLDRRGDLLGLGRPGHPASTAIAARLPLRVAGVTNTAMAVATAAAAAARTNALT